MIALRWNGFVGLGVLSALVLAGCGDDATPDGGADAAVDGSATDAGPEAPDGASRCSTDGDCDDGVLCTRDICDGAGYCRHPVDLAVCDDGTFCNGVEQCNPLRGCEPGPPESCNDDDVCTLDHCDEEGKTCRHGPRDFDEDGEADWHCEGGTDCDDRDPTRGMTASEICEDGVDNDCDGMIDEMGTPEMPACGRPPHDTCDDPLDVSAGGTFFVSNEGATPDYALTCDSSSRKDVVLTLTLAEPHDLRVRADGSGVTVVGLRTTCTDRLTETECGSGFPGQIRARSLAAGTYFVIVSDSGIGEIQVDVELSAPTPPPTNETCSMPTDLGAGGTFMGSWADVRDDLTTSCGLGASPDLTYSFTTTAPHNVRVALASTTGETVSFSVRSACADGATELRCARGTPASAVLHELPAGTYYVIVEGPSYREVDFQLDIELLPPAPPSAGDTCASAIALPLGVRTLGTLADKEDDHDISCGYYYRDAVYSFDLTARSDVTVTVDGGGTYMYASIRTTCTDGATQLRCASGSPSRSRLRDLAPGRYYIIAESYRGTGFNITVEATPPTPVVAVTGNDNCATAWPIPATGALFTGNTTGMMNDYTTTLCGAGASAPDAAFRLDLAAEKHVVASTDGTSFDTVLHVHDTMCVSGMELYCDDDGGDGVTSLIDRILPAGTYFFVVDGFGTSASGAYTLEVLLSDP